MCCVWLSFALDNITNEQTCQFLSFCLSPTHRPLPSPPSPPPQTPSGDVLFSETCVKPHVSWMPNGNNFLYVLQIIVSCHIERGTEKSRKDIRKCHENEKFFLIVRREMAVTHRANVMSWPNGGLGFGHCGHGG